MSFPDIHTEIPQRVHLKKDCNKPLPWQIAKRDDRPRRIPRAHRSKRGYSGVFVSRWMMFEGTNKLEILSTLLSKESSTPRPFSQGMTVYDVVDSETGQTVVTVWDTSEAMKWATALQTKSNRFFFVEPQG